MLIYIEMVDNIYWSSACEVSVMICSASNFWPEITHIISPPYLGVVRIAVCSYAFGHSSGSHVNVSARQIKQQGTEIIPGTSPGYLPSKYESCFMKADVISVLVHDICQHWSDVVRWWLFYLLFCLFVSLFFSFLWRGKENVLFFLKRKIKYS